MHVATTRTTIQIVHGLSTKSNVFHPVQESNVIVQDCSQVFKQLNNHFFDCHKFIVNFTKSVIGCSNFDNCSYTFFSHNIIPENDLYIVYTHSNCGNGIALKEPTFTHYPQIFTLFKKKKYIYNLVRTFKNCR